MKAMPGLLSGFLILPGLRSRDVRYFLKFYSTAILTYSQTSLICVSNTMTIIPAIMGGGGNSSDVKNVLAIFDSEYFGPRFY